MDQGGGRNQNWMAGAAWEAQSSAFGFIFPFI